MKSFWTTVFFAVILQTSFLQAKSSKFEEIKEDYFTYLTKDILTENGALEFLQENYPKQGLVGEIGDYTTEEESRDLFLQGIGVIQNSNYSADEKLKAYFFSIYFMRQAKFFGGEGVWELIGNEGSEVFKNAVMETSQQASSDWSIKQLVDHLAPFTDDDQVASYVGPRFASIFSQSNPQISQTFILNMEQTGLPQWQNIVRQVVELHAGYPQEFSLAKLSMLLGDIIFSYNIDGPMKEKFAEEAFALIEEKSVEEMAFNQGAFGQFEGELGFERILRLAEKPESTVWANDDRFTPDEDLVAQLDEVIAPYKLAFKKARAEILVDHFKRDRKVENHNYAKQLLESYIESLELIPEDDREYIDVFGELYNAFVYSWNARHLGSDNNGSFAMRTALARWMGAQDFLVLHEAFDFLSTSTEWDFYRESKDYSPEFGKHFFRYLDHFTNQEFIQRLQKYSPATTRGLVDYVEQIYGVTTNAENLVADLKNAIDVGLPRRNVDTDEITFQLKGADVNSAVGFMTLFALDPVRAEIYAGRFNSVEELEQIIAALEYARLRSALTSHLDYHEPHYREVMLEEYFPQAVGEFLMAIYENVQSQFSSEKRKQEVLVQIEKLTK